MPIERTIEHWRSLPHLSVKECAAVLGVGTGSVRTLLKNQELEARDFCGKTFVTVPSIRRVVDEPQGVQQPAAAPDLTRSERRIVRELRGDVAS